jgi:hypothetical protein
LLYQLHTTELSALILSIAIMKFTAALFASVATLSVANPLPLESDVKHALVARADIVPTTCPMLINNAATTYSVGNIEDAFNIGSGLLVAPVHLVEGNNSMY